MTADGLRLAVGTFTAIPVPRAAPDHPLHRAGRDDPGPAGDPADRGGGGHRWASSAGGRLVPDLVTAAVLIGVVALGSRGLHLDGLADTADGLAASYDRVKALEIMRRGNTGPIGAVALVIVVLIQIAAAAAILGRPWGALRSAGWSACPGCRC